MGPGDQGGLLQGQGFENIGDQTFIYYGAWDPRPTGRVKTPPRGGVGIAVLPRDRFGDLVVEEAGKGRGTINCRRSAANSSLQPSPSIRRKPTASM